MKHTARFFSLFLLCISIAYFSCDPDDDNSKGSFSYTVTGAATETISGDDTGFGITNGELFIRLTDGTDELTLRILIDPASAGSYAVNPILVNGQAQTIEPEDAFAELGIGSSLTGDRRNFSTDASNGGSVVITSVETNALQGNFDISMRELLGGGVNQPEINVQGDFTAVPQ